MKTKIVYFFIFSFLIFHFSCESSDSDGSEAVDSGKGGSMARFTIKGDYLYTVNNQTLKVFNIEDESTPLYQSSIDLGLGIETIFTSDNYLFIGSQFGMYIYSLENPANPSFVSEYIHIYSCDPVVVDGDWAYVTLHSENSGCGRWVNELHIIDISNIASPQTRQVFQMTNPLGLGVLDNRLFVCDAGLKVYDITNVPEIQLLYTFDIPARDVIPLPGRVIVIAEDGVYQYNYTNNVIELISKLSIDLAS